MISHEHECVFVHIPKCGGTSMMQVFLDDLGLTMEQRAPLLLRPRAEGELGPPRMAHLRARDYVRLHHLSQKLWDSYYTFSVTRDPYTRAASAYRYLNLDQRMPFRRYVNRHLTGAVRDAEHRHHWFLRPQVDFVTDESGAVMVDDLYRLEELDARFVELARKSRLGATVLPHENRTDNRAQDDTVEDGVRHPAEWTPDLRARVAELYAEDFERFDYPVA